MDNFYKEYRSPTDFFSLNDFIFRAANTIADFYQKQYDAKYAELRVDTRGGELVGFDPEFLMEQEILVEGKTNEAEIKYPVMSFLTSIAGVGYQELIPVEPHDANLERSNISETWMYGYAPFSNRILWRPQKGKIIFKSLGKCNIRKAKLFYIPSVLDKSGKPFPDSLVPDGVADYAIAATVLKMKQQIDGVIVKESLDGNSNKTMQTEMNLQSIKA